MKMLRLAEVIEMTGLSRSTIYRYEGQSEFPKRRRAGPNSVRWLEEDIVKWMETRPVIPAPPNAVGERGTRSSGQSH
jgi:prophage regulatory protein